MYLSTHTGAANIMRTVYHTLTLSISPDSNAQTRHAPLKRLKVAHIGRDDLVALLFEEGLGAGCRGGKEDFVLAQVDDGYAFVFGYFEPRGGQVVYILCDAERLGFAA